MTEIDPCERPIHGYAPPYRRAESHQPPRIRTMTPRERWLALFNRQPVDRIPTDHTATPEVTARLLA